MTEDMTEEQEKALVKAAGAAIWDLGLPLVEVIDTAESEFQLLIIGTFVGFLGEQVEKKRQELSDKEDK